MHDVFESYAEIFRRNEVQMPAPSIATEEAEQPAEVAECTCDRETLRAIRFFYAAVRERIERAVPRLLEDIAASVLARELASSPCDVARIVRRELERFEAEQPLRVRIHPSQVERVADVTALPVVADESLFREDAVIDVRDGSIDFSFGVRLQALLTEFPV